MQSPASHEALQTKTVWHAQTPCPAINDRAPGLVVCSLSTGAHDTHQLRCEDTGELLGEWTNADMTFREPANEPRRAIEFSDSQLHYGDVA
jgi:hypothetical protein